jgi:citrate lyase subunit beta/citryl-CoA lyase
MNVGPAGREPPLLRAVLFVPGNDERKLQRARESGADLVVADLEDAVAESEKTGARMIARAAIPRLAAHLRAAVRVNGLDTGRLEADIAAVAAPELSAIVVPKVESAGALKAADDQLSRAERLHGLPAGSIALIALLETPLGVARCEQILLEAPSRTVTTMFGVADFTAALGVDVSPEGTELLYARGRLVVAARAAGLAAPIDGPYLQIEDAPGLLEDSRRSRRLGFQGRVALHPRQVEPINRAFSELTPEELETARAIVSAFEAAQSGGVASIRVAGRFVDYPVYELARAKLRRQDAYLARGRQPPAGDPPTAGAP